MMSAMPLAAGVQVSKNLRLVRLLGRGGMGSVWVAHHAGLDREVAVKFVADELQASGDATVLARFSREAKLAAKIDSPYVVRVFDHGETDLGIPFIVMELLRGESLADRLSKAQRLSPAALVRAVRDIAEGLEAAHALGVVHRDIKPQNVFYAVAADGTETVKIVDFGIAKSDGITDPTTSATSSGVIVGTPQYMSPEQLMHAGPPDRSADVWALAVVTYEALVGRPPFTGATLAATLVAITRSEIEAPSSAVPGLPKGLDAFFGRAFSTRPEARFESPRALAEGLASAVENAGEDPVEIIPLSARSMAELPTGEFLAVGDTKRSASPELGFAATEPSTPRPVAPRIADGASMPAEATRRDGSAGRRPWILGGGALLVAGALLYAFLTSASADKTTPGADAPSSVVDAPPSSAAASPVQATSFEAVPATPASASAAPSALRVPVLARTKVKEGVAPHSTIFVSAFEVAHEPADDGGTFFEALDRCERKGLRLCTEAEWTRACEAEPTLARQASWTLSAATTALVTRGGTDCDTRDTSAPDVRDPARIGACCSRVVGTTSTGSNPAFLMTTAGKLLVFESTLNAGDARRFAAMSEPTVQFHGRALTGDDLAKAVEWVGKTSALFLDNCEVSIGDRQNAAGETERTWSAECVGLQTTPSKVARVARRITFGDGGLLEEVREPRNATFF